MFCRRRSVLPLAEIPQSCYVIFPRWRFEVSGLSGLWQYLRWVDDGSVGGDDDADDGEGLSAVRAVVVSARSGDVVRERTGDGGDGGVDGVVTVPLAPGRFAAVHAAVALA